MTASKSTSTRKTSTTAKKTAATKAEPVEKKVEAVEEPKTQVEEEVIAEAVPEESEVQVQTEAEAEDKDKGTPLVEEDPEKHREFLHSRGVVRTTGTPQETYDSMKAAFGVFDRKDVEPERSETQRHRIFRTHK